MKRKKKKNCNTGLNKKKNTKKEQEIKQHKK